MSKAQNLYFGDLALDKTCLFASRDGQRIQFTRNERALLLAFTLHPNQLMRRSHLLDEIAALDSDRSDRYIDFLINRLRAKLGDDTKSPKYIATQYGEGYVWIAAPSPAKPIDGFLVIGPAFGSQGYPFHQQALSLVDQLRDLVAAAVGADYKVFVVAENWHPAPADKLHYFLQVSFHADDGRLNCAAALREMSSKRIVKAFSLRLDVAHTTSVTSDALRISKEVVDFLRQALGDASAGLGTPTDELPEMRLHKASTLLSASNPQWLEKGEQLSKERERDPRNPDIALQWCMHLFARLVLVGPFAGMSTEDRDRIESEIETTVLQLLPVVEGAPLLMLVCAKMLYFINRGHLNLVEDITERACARAGGQTAALPILAQIHYAHGRFDEAIKIFDRGIAMADATPAMTMHLRVLRCMAYLAAGDRAGLDNAAVGLQTFLAPFCPPDLALSIDWTFAAPDRKLSAASAKAFAAIGFAGARNAIENLYYTSARHLISERARANVMRAKIAHVTNFYGEQAIPAFVLKSIGLIPAV